MTAAEKRKALADKILSREGKNTYTQGPDRGKVASGYGDCSSTVRWVYKEVLGIDIGCNTEAQLNSKNLVDVNLVIKNGIPDRTKLLPGDLFYFRGNDDSRTKGVGHVEEYIGNGVLMGHGSGIGPSKHDMNGYCTKRYASISDSAELKNKGLICVRRATIKDDVAPAPVKKPAMPAVKPATTSIKPTIDKTLLKGYVGCSIVDALLSKKLSVTLPYRKTLAEAVGIHNYKGTKEQNLLLIKELGGTVK
jgi:hypothetical protein